jgi:DNA repair protein RecN (Recombination protein N)
MLQSLSIENYALINSLQISFGAGFNVITGETGAGKSIILGALALILGNRADTQVLRNNSLKCTVEGVFKVDEKLVEDVLLQNDLDSGEELILRREILPSGKSRAFVNDTPVSLGVMKELGEKLVDIHSQHHTLLINESSFQLSIIDHFAGNGSLLASYATLFKNLKNLETELESLQESEKKALTERDYLIFLRDEFVQARLTSNEQELLEREQEILTHAEEIKQRSFQLTQALDGEESAILPVLSSLLNSLQQLTKFYPDAEELVQRFSSVNFELKDITQSIEKIGESVHHNPERIEEVSNRLDVIYRLQQKHRVSSVEGLLQVFEDVEQKLASIGSLQDQIDQLKIHIAKDYSVLRTLASRLHEARLKVVQPIEKDLVHTLRILGMPDADLAIKIEGTDGFTPYGTDKAQFLFTANKGQEIKPISKIASGGELSRLMLALKSLVVNRSFISTLVFDEIDSGVSGEIAGRAGELMRKMAVKIQIIAITHLPQIAGKAQDHYFVYKEAGKNETSSFIKRLSDSERITEIAKMLSNERITDAAVEAAKQLLN